MKFLKILSSDGIGMLFSPLRRLNKKRKLFFEFEKIMELYSNSDCPEILYLSDSVGERISDKDKNKSQFAEILKKRFRKQIHLDYITHTAYQSMIFYYLINILRFTRYKPQYIILPINLRSFSPQWDYNPLWQFDKEIFSIKSYLDIKDDYFGSSGICEIMHYNKGDLKVFYPGTELNTLKQFQDLVKLKNGSKNDYIHRKKNIFIYHYLYNLQKEHRKIIYFQRICSLMDKLHVKTFLYFTPINFKAGEKFVGAHFTEKVSKNIEIIKSSIQYPKNNNVLLLKDYSFLLSPDKFFNEANPTEHLNESGRAILADSIFEDFYRMNI
jgi:hypothetical protein